MKTILIVDPHEDFRAAITLYLNHRGYNVLEAMDTAQGLDLVGSSPVDLILCSLETAAEDCTKLVTKAREGNHVPTIATSNYSSSEDQGLATQMGFDHYFGKPYDLKLLGEAVLTLIGLPSAV